MTVVLDTSAVLAFVQGEPGADRTEAAMHDAIISSVNLGELVAKLVDRGGSRKDCDEILSALALDVTSHGTVEAREAGELRRVTRQHGLSLGDRACLALAKRLGHTVLTADRAWAEIDLDIEIDVIR